MHILIAYGSKGKYFHLKEFEQALKKFGVQCTLVHDIEYSNGFPSKQISEWLSNKKIKRLISEKKPDVIFVDRQSHFAKNAIQLKIPVFVLLRGHYWQEYEWALKTNCSDLRNKIILNLRNKISEQVFKNCELIFPICEYLNKVVLEKYPHKKTFVFSEGVDGSRWYVSKGMKLKHPCVGLVQDANWWGKTKEMLILKTVLRDRPDVFFYWAGDGPFRERIIEELKDFHNFKWLGRLEYPTKVRQFLSEIDIYALISGMDLAPLTLKEAQLMEKPVIATNVGGIPEMMIDKETGFLVSENNSKELINIIDLLLKNPSLREKMGKSGREFILENFSWDLIARRFLKNINNHLKVH